MFTVISDIQWYSDTVSPLLEMNHLDSRNTFKRKRSNLKRSKKLKSREANAESNTPEISRDWDWLRRIGGDGPGMVLYFLHLLAGFVGELLDKAHLVHPVSLRASECFRVLSSVQVSEAPSTLQTPRTQFLLMIQMIQQQMKAQICQMSKVSQLAAVSRQEGWGKGRWVWELIREQSLQLRLRQGSARKTTYAWPRGSQWRNRGVKVVEICHLTIWVKWNHCESFQYWVAVSH